MAFIVAQAFAIDRDEVVASLQQSEHSLGPACGQVVISISPAFQTNVAIGRWWGPFDWKVDSRHALWKQHLSDADLAPMRGARDLIWEVRPEGLLRYEVYKDYPKQPGQGLLGNDGPESPPIVNTSPLIGRVYRGYWLSDVVAKLQNPQIRLDGQLCIVTGQYPFGPKAIPVSFTFDPSKGWLAVAGTVEPAPDQQDQWVISETQDTQEGSYVVQATETERAPRMATRTTTYAFSGLKTGATAQALTFPKPVDRTIVSAPNDDTDYLFSDGRLESFLNRKAPQRGVLTWNLLFVLSSAALLLGSLAWLASSKRRLASSA